MNRKVLRAWLERWGLVTLVCAGGLALRAYVAFTGYYWQDDFHYLESARVSSLGADYLLQDISGNGHIMPATFFVAWLATRVESAPHPIVAAAVILLQALALAAMVWTTRQIARGDWALLAIAVFAFTPLGLVGVSWWSFGMQGLALQASLLCSVGALTAHFRTGQSRWAVVQVASVIFGLIFWEKALVVPIAALGTVTCFTWSAFGGGPTYSWLRRSWRLWAANGAVLAAYLAVYLTWSTPAPVGDNGARGWELVLNALPRNLLVGLLGGPWRASGDDQTLMPLPEAWVQWLSALAAIAIVVSSLVRGGTRAAIAWVPAVGAVVMDVFLVVSQRGEWAAVFMRDPRYFFDAIPIVLLSATAAFRVPRSGRRPAHTATSSRAAAYQAVGGLILSCLISTSAMLPNHQHQYARSYVTTLRNEALQHPGLVLADARAPTGEVLIDQVRDITTAFDLPVSYDATAGPLRMVDGFGRIVGVSLPDPEGERDGPVSGCGWELTEGSPVFVPLRSRPGSHNRVIKMNYGTVDSEPALVSVSVPGAPEHLIQTTEREGTIYLQSTEPVDSLTVKVIQGQGVCLRSVAVGEPWPSTPDG